jgi:hypothetical protein
MSSSEFSKVLVRDERLDCHPSIPFAVYKSGQNVTVATFDAISAAVSSHTYNIQVPSETTVIDRRVMWQSTVEFNVTMTLANTGTGITAASSVLKFGSNCGFSPYPLHSLCTTQQVTINNNTVSINMNDVLPAVVKLGTDRELAHYNGLALTQGDFYRDAAATASYVNSPLYDVRGVANDRSFKPRGTLAGLTFGSPTLNGAAVTAPGGGGGSIYSWNATFGAQGTPLANGGIYSITVTATFLEPLIVSPFIYSNPYYNGQGFYGIQNLNYVFNIAGGATSGFFRTAFPAATAYPAAGATVTLQRFLDSKLVFNFLSPKPSDMLTARNVVPYWEMPRFTSSNFSGPVAATANADGTITPQKTTVQSQSIQLNQIPDKLIIFVRRAKSARTTQDTDFSFPIENIAINFNNQSGILASASKDQLWRYSVESGSNQTWDEYSGVANAGQLPGVPTNDTPMLGSYLMLEFGRHIQITEDYYASGSLGNFNLQFSVTIQNYSQTSYAAAGSLELVLITQNSGIFVTEKGQSATYTGVLTKDDVLSASSSAAVNERALTRMVGGVKFGKIADMAKVLGPIANNLGNAFLPEDSKIRKGLNVAEKLRGAVQGEGKAGSRIRGSGKGSAAWSLEDRLV